MPNGFDAYYSSVLTTLKTKESKLTQGISAQQAEIKKTLVPPETNIFKRLLTELPTMANPITVIGRETYKALHKKSEYEKAAATKDTLLQAESELARTRQLMGAVSLLYTDKSASFDEFRAKFAGEKSVLQPDDYNVLQELYNRRTTKYEVVPAAPTAPGVPPLQPTLKQLELPPRPTPTGLDLMTTDEILKSLRAPAMPTLPTGLTGDQAKDIFQYTDLDEWLDENDAEIIKQMHDVYDTSEAIKAGIASIEVPSLNLWEILKEIVGQPALAAMDLGQALSERYSRPISGMAMSMGSQVFKFVAGQTDEENWIINHINKATGEGETLWEAFGSLYDIEDQQYWNTGTKLLAEIILDPTNLLGFTFVSKGALKIPLIGKYIAGFNNAYIRIWDDVFYGLVKLFKRAPKTPSQTAAAMTSEARTALRMAMVDATNERNPARWTVEQLRKVAEDSRNFVIEHPELANTSNASRFGKWQMTRRPVSSEEVADWTSKLGMKEKPAIETVSEIDLAYGQMKISGKGTGYTVTETADRVAKSLGVPNTKKNLGVIAKLLGNRDKADLKLIEKIFDGKDVDSVMKKFLVHVDEQMNDILTSPVTTHNMKSAKMTAFLAGIDDNVKAGLIGAIDKHITIPLSRQYLYFPAIGPGNVIETVGRAALRGHNVIPGMIHGNPTRLAQWRFAHLPNLPVDIAEAQVRGILSVAPEAGTSALKPGVGDFVPVLDRLTPPGVVRDIEMFGAKWWKKVPKPLKSLKSFYDYMSKLGFNGMAVYLSKEFDEALSVLAPASVKAAKEASKSLKNLGLKIPKGELVDRIEMVRQASLIGPDAVKSLKSTPTEFMMERVGTMVDDILNTHPTLSEPVRNFIKQRAVVRTLDDIDAFMPEARAILKDTEIIDSMYAANMYEEFARGLTSVPITTPEQLDVVMRTLADMGKTHVDNLSTWSRLIQKRADELKTAVARDDTYYEGWQKLSKYMSKVDDSVQEMIDAAKSSLVSRPLTQNNVDGLQTALQYLLEIKNMKGISDAKLDHLTSILEEFGIDTAKLANLGAQPIENIDLLGAKLRGILSSGKFGGVELDPVKRGGIESLLNIRGEMVKLNSATRLRIDELHRTFATKWGKKPRGDKFWNTINPMKQTIWDEHWKLHMELSRDEALAVASLATKPQPALPKFAGDLLVGHISYLFEMTGDNFASGLLRGATGNFMSKQAFIDTVSAKAEAVARAAGTTADDAGFTVEAISRCYDDIFRSFGLDPNTVTEITPKLLELDDIEKRLRYAKVASGVDPADVEKYNQFLDNIAARTDTGVPYDTQVKAMEMARKSKILDFPDYTDPNAGSMIMKKIYPFWTYEANRPFWVPRTFLQKPGLFNVFGKYMNTTDAGYIPIPTTDYEFNPFIGSVFMGGFRRFFKRDYPEYAGQYPWISEPIDWFSRGGFYPGPVVGTALAIFGTSIKRSPEYGDIAPPWASTGISMLQAIAPDNRLVQTITETIFPSRWRNYLAGLQLDDAGYDGKVIIAKINEGVELDEAEQLAYVDAQKKVAIFQACSTQAGGMIRLNPEKRRAVYEASSKIVEGMTGMSPEVQDWIYQHQGVTGKNQAYYMPLDPLQQKILYEASGLRDWARTSNPLLPPEQQEAMNRIVLYQAECLDIRDQANTSGYKDYPSFEQMDTMLLNYFRSIYDPTVDKSQTMTPGKWIQSTGELKGALVAAYDVLGESQLYKNVPRTLEERLAMYKKYGITLVFHPTQELLWEFNEIKPEMVEDPDFGWSVDYTTYFKKKAAILAAIDDEDKPRFLENMQMNWTPMYKLFWSVNRDYLKKYKMVREIVLSEYSPEEQSVIKRIAVAPLAEREALLAVLDETGKKLYNQFDTKVRTVRRNLRLLDPTLDAWLLIWGVVDSPATDNGRKAYETITRDLATGDLSGYIQ